MTTYDEIGGAPAVEAAVDVLYQKLTSDPELVRYFNGVSLGRLKGHQRAFIAAAVGGPEPYVGRDMATAHAGLGVTDAAFDAVVSHLVATLQELEVSADVIAQIREALSPLRADIVTGAAVPSP